jgi:hypothetical protein
LEEREIEVIDAGLTFSENDLLATEISFLEQGNSALWWDSNGSDCRRNIVSSEIG